MIESSADIGGKTNTKVQWTPLMQLSIVVSCRDRKAAPSNAKFLYKPFSDTALHEALKAALMKK